jgi:hypothetical protein
MASKLESGFQGLTVTRSQFSKKLKSTKTNDLTKNPLKMQIEPPVLHMQFDEMATI